MRRDLVVQVRIEPLRVAVEYQAERPGASGEAGRGAEVAHVHARVRAPDVLGGRAAGSLNDAPERRSVFRLHRARPDYRRASS